jgi:hypothetical protein
MNCDIDNKSLPGAPNHGYPSYLYFQPSGDQELFI